MPIRAAIEAICTNSSYRRRVSAGGSERDERASTSQYQKRVSNNEFRQDGSSRNKKGGHGLDNTVSRPTVSLDSKPNGLDLYNILSRGQIDVRNFYYFKKELGSGASGVVHLCSDVITGESVACKTILKSTLRCPLDIRDLKSEVATLRSMQEHPNVIQLKGVFEDEKSVRLVMEYGSGGDLFDRIKQRRYFSEPEAAIVCRTIASVLHFGHKHGVMHRDLKPENILLMSQDSDTDIRIADFGSATFFKPGQRLNQLVGSPVYIAPEVLIHDYGTAADLWSLGVILYILLSGRPPFHGSTTTEIIQSVREDKLDLESGRWKAVSNAAKKVVARLLVRDERKRLTAKQVMKHPWICYHVEKMANMTKESKFCFRPDEWDIVPPSEEKKVRFEGIHDGCYESEDVQKSKLTAFVRSPTPFAPTMDLKDEEEIPVADLVRESPIVSRAKSSGRLLDSKDKLKSGVSKFFGYTLGVRGETVNKLRKSKSALSRSSGKL